MFGEANDWPMSGQGGIHQLPSRTFTGRNEGGYCGGLHDLHGVNPDALAF